MPRRCLMRLPGLRAPFPGLVSWIVVRPSPSQTRPRCPGWIDLPIRPPSAVRAVVAPISTVSLCLYFVAADRARSLAPLRDGTQRRRQLARCCLVFVSTLCYWVVRFAGRVREPSATPGRQLSIQSLPSAAVAPFRLSRLSPATLPIILCLPCQLLHT